MENQKIPKGYRGTYGVASDGSPVLIMVSHTENIMDYTEKEQKSMADNKHEQMSMTDTPQPAQGQYVHYTTEQKKNTQSNLLPNNAVHIDKDSGTHTHIWEISASAILLLFTAI